MNLSINRSLSVDQQDTTTAMTQTSDERIERVTVVNGSNNTKTSMWRTTPVKPSETPKKTTSTTTKSIMASVPLQKGTARYTEEYCQSVLVTGGVGFIGSHIAETLLKEGRKVVVYDIFNAETTSSAEKHQNAMQLRQTAKSCGANLTIVRGDIRDRDLLTKIVQEHGITGCIHMAGMVDDRASVYSPEEHIDINIRGTAVLLDVLGKCGVKMVVQSSTRSVFGQRLENNAHLNEQSDRRPINPYGASRTAADAFGHAYSHLHDMNVTVVRIDSTYGPRGRPDMILRILLTNIHHDRPIKKFGDGTATRTWIYISDIVNAFILGLKNPRGGYDEYNTGAREPTPLNDLFAAAEAVVGKKAIVVHYPAPPGDALTVGRSSYAKFREELGWEPEVDLVTGMRLTYEHFLQQLEEEQKVNKEHEESTTDFTESTTSFSSDDGEEL